MKFTFTTVIVSSLVAQLSTCLPAEGKETKVSTPVPSTTVYQVYPPLETGQEPAKRDVDLEKRTLGGFYFCDYVNWGFPCNKLFFGNGECRSFNGWIDMGSVGPDPGTWCILYGGHGCTDQKTGAFTSPGNPENGYSSARYVGSILCWY